MKEAFSQIREIAFQPSSFLVEGGGCREKNPGRKSLLSQWRGVASEAVKGQARSL